MEATLAPAVDRARPHPHFGVVLFPVGVMFWNSTRDISQSGVDNGLVGLANYATVVGFPYFWPIFGRTVVWVVVVVGCTVIGSLGARGSS